MTAARVAELIGIGVSAADGHVGDEVEWLAKLVGIGVDRKRHGEQIVFDVVIDNGHAEAVLIPIRAVGQEAFGEPGGVVVVRTGVVIVRIPSDACVPVGFSGVTAFGE